MSDKLQDDGSIRYGRIDDKLPPDKFYTLPSLEDADYTAILDELDDPKFSGRQHYNNSTYNAGCRGLLCTTSHTDLYRHRRLMKEVRKPDALKPSRFTTTGRERALAAFIATMLEVEMREEPYYLSFQLIRCELISPNTYSNRTERLYLETALRMCEPDKEVSPV